VFAIFVAYVIKGIGIGGFGQTAHRAVTRATVEDDLQQQRRESSSPLYVKLPRKRGRIRRRDAPAPVRALADKGYRLRHR
jgi:hypothetical protein